MTDVRSLALLVEGNLDEAVGRRLAQAFGFEVSVVYGKRGCDYIKSKISGFNDSAISTPILTLVDLMDTGEPCPPEVIRRWIRGSQRPAMIFRVVVREIESWLLADPQNLAEFLNVPRDKVPDRPEDLPDPKRAVIQLARRSRRMATRRLLVPNPSGTAREGPGYTSAMCRFARKFWDPEIARGNAPSLASCIAAISRFYESSS